MNAILIDDEENNLKNLEALLLKYCPEVKIIAKCTDAFDGKNKIELFKPSLVFLDINMPKVNGLELLKMYIKEFGENTKTIIITAYEEFALEAFKTGCFAYILKPIDKSELISAVEKAKEYFNEKKKIASLSEVTVTPIIQEEDSKLIINSEEGYVVLNYDDIIKIEAVNTYSRIFDVNEKQYLVSKPLKYYDETLPKNRFIRIHKSFIINTLHVQRIGKSDDSKTVYLTNNLQAIVAKNKKVMLKKLLAH